MDLLYDKDVNEHEIPCESAPRDYDKRLIMKICESAPRDYDKRLIMKICELIVDNLNISQQDKNTVINLMYAGIKDRVLGRGKLLEQYLHSQLDEISDSIKSRLDLDENLKTDYNYATHAKFSTIIKAIKDKYKKEDNENI